MLLARSRSPATSRAPTPRSSRWARASSAPTPASASPASRSARSSTPRPGSAATPIACLRVSFADPRDRHRRPLAPQRDRAAARDPQLGARPGRRRSAATSEARLRADLDDAGHRPPPRPRRRRAARHRRRCSRRHGLHVASMGRPAADDPALFQMAAAAGRVRRRAHARPSMRAMPDAPGRVERVLNLLAPLLDTRVPLTRDELVARGQPAIPPQIVGVPARVRARQGEPARHRRPDHGRDDRRRRRDRLPHPPRRLLPPRARPRRRGDSPRCTSR